MAIKALQRSAIGPARVFEVAPDVACLELPIVNVCFIGERLARDRGWVLVDAGMPTSGHSIVREAERRFGPGARPSAIVLTHGHFDHAGSVRSLAERWDVPVYAHRLEAPYLTGRSDYPPADPTVGGGAMARVASRFFPRSPIDLGPRLRLLNEDGSLPGMAGWRWIHTPGHTPGHVSLFRDADRVLIAGDAFVTMRQESLISVLTRRQEVSRPPAYFTPDWESSRDSLQELARLDPAIAATGHGIPMFGIQLHSELEALARYFDDEIPRHGRYVDQPALADERGIVRVPPPVFDPLPPLVLSLGVLAILGTKLLRGSPVRRPALLRG
ncbi:MAG: MBL fold metallo-hydrolase [Acidobacteria bacterium]|nr:MBL fold metallo-hydrolase [Acidobacteriota bacterium]